MFKNLGFQHPRTSKSPIKRQNVACLTHTPGRAQNGSVSPMKIMRKPDVAKVPLPFRPNRSQINRANQGTLMLPSCSQQRTLHQQKSETRLFQRLLQSKKENIEFNPSSIKYISNPLHPVPNTPRLLLSKGKAPNPTHTHTHTPASVPAVKKEAKENIDDYNYEQVMMSIADHRVNLSDSEDFESKDREYNLTMDPWL